MFGAHFARLAAFMRSLRSPAAPSTQTRARVTGDTAGLFERGLVYAFTNLAHRMPWAHTYPSFSRMPSPVG